MSRPRKYPPRLTTAIRFKPETHDALVAAAEERDLSINCSRRSALSTPTDATKPPNPEAEGNADEQHSEATPTPQHQRWIGAR